MNPQNAGRLLVGCTVGVSAYCLCWLCLPPFYRDTRAIQLLFPSPLYLIYLGAFGVLFLVVGSLCIGSVLMLRYDDPRLGKREEDLSPGVPLSSSSQLAGRRIESALFEVSAKTEALDNMAGETSESRYGVLSETGFAEKLEEKGAGLRGRQAKVSTSGNTCRHGEDKVSSRVSGSAPRAASNSPTTKARMCSLSSDGSVAEGVMTVRPFLRGKIHLALFLLSPLWILFILSACSSPSSFVAAAISCFTFVWNFLASALLHCFEWTNRPGLYQLLHKLDHAGIFMVISGSTTPIPMLLLDASSSCWLLLVQLAATIYGFCSIIFGELTSTGRTRRAYTYIFVGLLHALFLSEYYRVLKSSELVAVFALASLYVVGALVYSCKRPDPFPAIYGFHEVFHSFCFLSFLLTLWLDYVVIRRVEWGAARSAGTELDGAAADAEAAGVAAGPG
ncbi:hemolysin-III related subfamily protein [Besnoitia besnoiti]|uniref:Hemolysin-III related subfamily protein n=1 Tax=Besnoitia besnoiti TaxID=94643 RepID=A0A2A9ML23_BESBE|nr:hemolysin-III related subfamily protein [Besnoitia besnoiti]PFH36383.1 hemolysin-III related subfamily protein [Besnoitia besnoiti]